MADRIDDKSALVCFSGYFNLVLGKGLVTTQTEGVMCYPEAPGTPLYYFRDEYDRAFTQ